MWFDVRQFVMNSYWKFIEVCKNKYRVKHEPSLMDFMIWLDTMGYLNDEKINKDYGGER